MGARALLPERRCKECRLQSAEFRPTSEQKLPSLPPHHSALCNLHSSPSAPLYHINVLFFRKFLLSAELVYEFYANPTKATP